MDPALKEIAFWKAANGNADSSKSRIALACLTQVRLALQQDWSTNPVSIAMPLERNAANWRDTVFLPSHASQAVIPCAETETNSRPDSWIGFLAWKPSRTSNSSGNVPSDLLRIFAFSWSNAKRNWKDCLTYMYLMWMLKLIYLAGILSEISQEI